MNDASAWICSRQSVGVLTEPAPSAAQLAEAIQAAMTAPDHHRLRPWRFYVVSGDARVQLGDVLAQALLAQGETDPAQLARVRAQPLRAPLLVVCVMQAVAHPKVPVVEQVLSTGAAIENLLLVLHAQGFAAMWRTGLLTESPVVKAAFALQADDVLAGFVYIGSASKPPAPRVLPAIDSFVHTWTAPLAASAEHPEV